MSSPTPRIRALLASIAVATLTAVLLPAVPAAAFPVASDLATYDQCGRVFPDPMAYWPSPQPAPGQSPWAKGNAVCRATDFLGWQETIDGLHFLADDLFPDFVEVYDLSKTDGRFADILDQASGEGMSAGLPTEDLGREPVPMYLVRVTDEQDTSVPIDERERFAYTLSIHGIERAGVEGGIRAIEDLATWASCEKDGSESKAHCDLEGAMPHPILETMPDESVTAGQALKESSVWFVLSNPDGWRRGDKQDGGFFYQRYNGNGVDMNRDWPTQGFTFRPYTPWSEPENRAVGKTLKGIADTWSGGIDLHGQLIDRAFSFTLLGGNQRAFDKNQRVLQFVKGAWADAEQRLAWSSLIKPNDEPPSCAFVADPTSQECDPTNRIYGVQWGTVWDTIAYTVTGALGDWMDSQIGLDADGIDNEMSLSHLSNCGVGTCYLPDAEQLHVDGNKSLVYAMIHYTLTPEDTTFDYAGRAAYLFNPDRIRDAGGTDRAPTTTEQLPPQDGFDTTIDHTGDTTTYEFEVKGPDQGVHNAGIRAQITWNNLRGVSAGSLNEIAIDRYRGGETDPSRGGQPADDWVTVNSYYNQAPTYLQSGAQLDVNEPTPGRYRIRISGVAPSQFHASVDFLSRQAWPDPGQVPYDVSNMDFFDDLAPFVASPDKLTKVPVDAVLNGQVDLSRFDTVVAVDGALLPGYVEPQPAPDHPQDPVEGQVTAGVAGAGVRNDATSAYLEFDVEPGQASLDAVAEATTVVDPDLYLQRQQDDGTWSGNVASGESGQTQRETLTYANPQPGHYRLEVHDYAGAPGPVDVTITFAPNEPVENTSGYTAADRDRVAATLTDFAAQGGNVVLTDDALRGLAWMGIVPDDAVTEQAVYAGNVQFTDDGGDTATYDDPLAADVDQPGAAEGPGHRHQVAEPVPTGYAIMNAQGGDFNSHPEWSVDRTAFEDAGGRVVGQLGQDVSLGEVPVGDGVVRVLGSLLPTPTEAFDHPYGLASYGVTYTGYAVLRNLMDWTNPNGAAAGAPTGGEEAPAPAPAGEAAAAPLPTTGGGGDLVPLAMLALLGALALAHRRRRIA